MILNIFTWNYVLLNEVINPVWSVLYQWQKFTSIKTQFLASWWYCGFNFKKEKRETTQICAGEIVVFSETDLLHPGACGQIRYGPHIGYLLGCIRDIYKGTSKVHRKCVYEKKLHGFQIVGVGCTRISLSFHYIFHKLFGALHIRTVSIPLMHCNNFGREQLYFSSA